MLIAPAAIAAVLAFSRSGQSAAFDPGFQADTPSAIQEVAHRCGPRARWVRGSHGRRGRCVIIRRRR